MKQLLVIFLVIVFSDFAVAQALTKKEKEILRFIDENYDESIAFLKRTVDQNSGTNNLAGVRAVGAMFDDEFRKTGFETRWIDMPAPMKRAGHLFAEKKGTKGKRLLLIGHLDTVFEPDSPFQTWKDQDSIATGPGAVDMKGGDVILLYALKALQQAAALRDARIIVALHGDEENAGSPDSISRKDLIDAAKRSDYALAFETATGFGYATIARRGYIDWQLKTTGKRSHSGGIFSAASGAGAIYEASRILTEFYRQLPEQYLTFNPGVIVGGSQAELDNAAGRATGKNNIVAETALVRGDLRFMSREQLETAQKKMTAIVAQHLPVTDATITFSDYTPAMPPTEGNYQLLAALSKASTDLGFGEVQPWDPGKRGAGDISFITSYISGIDGLGPMGGGSHELTETMDLKTFKDLTKRAAIYIYRLTR